MGISTIAQSMLWVMLSSGSTKVKLDEYCYVLKKQSIVSCKGIRQEEGIILKKSFALVAWIEAHQNIFGLYAGNQDINIYQWMSKTAFSECSLLAKAGTHAWYDTLFKVPVGQQFFQCTMRIMRDVKIQEEVRREVLSFLEKIGLAVIKRNKEARVIQLHRLNTIACLELCLNLLDASQLKDYRFELQ
ncbi:hypothetical protein Tco_1108746 [Tanacetum coccineum]